MTSHRATASTSWVRDESGFRLLGTFLQWPRGRTALIKGYLRLGAKLLGAPAWDPDFNTADLPMLMRINDLPPRYRKHFLGA